MEITKEIYSVTKKFPDDERFGLVAQMRRSAISIPSNIAEGFNRYHNKEYRHFLFTALGSLAELETQVELSFQLKYLLEKLKLSLLEKLDHETGMIRNLIKKL
ncbi:MAG TPA: four helix bundle protein [Deltaproteobacteria bacterium]|nr:four helix bundle protein [Deltaproteobacteria bacterium]